MIVQRTGKDLVRNLKSNRNFAPFSRPGDISLEIYCRCRLPNGGRCRTASTGEGPLCAERAATAIWGLKSTVALLLPAQEVRATLGTGAPWLLGALTALQIGIALRLLAVLHCLRTKAAR